MDTLIVISVVMVAVGFLARTGWRSWRASRSAGCVSDCGCSPTSKAPASWDKTGVV